jgi:hypothetical protein
VTHLKPFICDQNYLHLASIQCVSLGIPAAITGKNLAHHLGIETAILSILTGFLLLWIIAIAIISMALDKRLNSLENVRTYLGTAATLFAGIVLASAFLNWYILQLNSAGYFLQNFVSFTPKFSPLKLGAGMGFLIALIAMGGIRVIQRMTTFTLPLVIAFYLYSIFRFEPQATFSGNWNLSIPAVLVTIFSLLPGVINLPTFFRHSKTKADSYLAVTVMTVLLAFFEIGTIWIPFTGHASLTFSLTIIAFILWTLICTNFLNIYFASACWEFFFPKFEGAKGYAITGLLGTAGYTFIQIYKPIEFIGNLANSYIACLGVILMLGFITKLAAQRSLRPLEQRANCLCWLTGCAVATAIAFLYPSDNTKAILGGMGSSFGAFCILIFIEANSRSVRRLLRKS